MAEPLRIAPSSFAQDVFEPIAPGTGTPGVRRLDDVVVVSVRHFAHSTSVRAGFDAQALPLPAQTNELCEAQGVLIARTHPEQLLLAGRTGAANTVWKDGMQQRFSSCADVIVFDLTHGQAVFELHGPAIDAWLAHVVDASAIPPPGSASRCRCIDIAVVLMRPSSDCVWLLADRALAPYLSAWLAFSHEGAFERL